MLIMFQQAFKLSWNLSKFFMCFFFLQIKQLSAYSRLHPDSLFVLILNCILGKLVTKSTVAKDWDIVEIILEMLFVSLHNVEKQDGSFGGPKEVWNNYKLFIGDSTVGWSEHWIHNPVVLGSIPALATRWNCIGLGPSLDKIQFLNHSM